MTPIFVILCLLAVVIFSAFTSFSGIVEGYQDQGHFQGQRRPVNQPIQNNYNGTVKYGEGNGDHYNHYEQKSTVLQPGSVYTGQNGGKATVKTDNYGNMSLEVTLPNGKNITMNSKPTERNDTLSTKEGYTTYYGYNGEAVVFYGPYGETATVVKGDNGHYAIRIETSEGTFIYGPYNSVYNENDNYNYNSGYNVNTYNGYYGGEVKTVTGPYGNTAVYAEDPYGNSTAEVVYTGDQYYYGPDSAEVTTVTGPYGNTVVYAEGPYGNSVTGVVDPTVVDYHSALPPGIPRHRIPPGQEDLYILKSQVVPPVCPACPVAPATVREECPPCKPCGRCPEPSFECKKVPNYHALGRDDVPVAVLNDFSTFGM